ncbi:MucBP domain-containing protein, partial [Parvimonas sp. G1641]|uniref:MucBP domain-containing protein n=1 Tax=Parvimonas sp. G1641 TaxID=3388846 RepID=UPI003980E309
YVDENGNELKDPKQDTPKSPYDTPYDTTEEGEKPNTIEKDGKTYKLVPKGDYPVGKVDENGHLVSSDPITGKVDKPKSVITYVYKEVKEDPAQPKGNVYVHYKDTEGNELKTSVKDMDQQPVDSDYDTVVDNRPQEIVKDGKTYVLVPAGNYTVGEVDNQGHLKSSDPTTGKVAEQDKNVTYIYKLKEDPTPQPQPDPAQPKGNVYVHYKDTEGNELKTSVKDMDQQPVDSDYDTVVDNRPQEIVKDGKTYVLVPAGNYTVGEVDNQGHLKSSDPTTGKVAEQDKNVTYIYKLKEDPTPQPQPDPAQPKGNVYVHYKDTEGNELKTSVKDMDQQPVDSDYDTVVDNRPQEIVKDGKTYVLVPAGNYTVGEVDNQGHLKSSDPTTGKVAEQDKNVTYIYKLKEDPTPQPQPDPAQPKGNVYVYYKDTEGNVIKSRVTDEDAQPVDKDYDTVVDNRPQEIVKDGKTYVLVPAGNYTVGSVDSEGHLESSDSTTGKVVEGDKHVTYIYKLKEEPVVPGKPGKPGEPGKPGDPGKGNRLPKTGVASSSALLSLVTVLTGAMGIVINSKKRK